MRYTTSGLPNMVPDYAALVLYLRAVKPFEAVSVLALRIHAAFELASRQPAAGLHRPGV